MDQVRARRRTGFAAAAVAVTVLAAAGCSVGKPAHRSFTDPSDEPSVGLPLGNQVAGLDPAAILQRAQAATAAAAFVHVKGTVGDGGKNAFAVDMNFTSTGSDGTIKQDSMTARVTRVQNQVWFQGDSRFWSDVGSTQADVANSGKYVQVPANDKRFAGLVDNTYIERLVAKLLGKPGALEKGEARDVNGRRAIPLVDKGAGGGTIWVATEGAPYFVRFESAADAKARGSVDFLGYNERTVVNAPDPDQVVDKDLSPAPTRGGSTKKPPSGSNSTSGSGKTPVGTATGTAPGGGSSSTTRGGTATGTKSTGR